MNDEPGEVSPAQIKWEQTDRKLLEVMGGMAEEAEARRLTDDAIPQHLRKMVKAAKTINPSSGRTLEIELQKFLWEKDLVTYRWGFVADRAKFGKNPSVEPFVFAYLPRFFAALSLRENAGNWQDWMIGLQKTDAIICAAAAYDVNPAILIPIVTEVIRRSGRVNSPGREQNSPVISPSQYYMLFGLGYATFIPALTTYLTEIAQIRPDVAVDDAWVFSALSSVARIDEIFSQHYYAYESDLNDRVAQLYEPKSIGMHPDTIFLPESYPDSFLLPESRAAIERAGLADNQVIANYLHLVAAQGKKRASHDTLLELIEATSPQPGTEQTSMIAERRIIADERTGVLYKVLDYFISSIFERYRKQIDSKTGEIWSGFGLKALGSYHYRLKEGKGGREVLLGILQRPR